MLMQNFKSAADLEITERQLSALQKTLVLLETGKLIETSLSEANNYKAGTLFSGHFNMETWNSEHPCGTVACIGGTAELIGGVEFTEWPDNLDILSWPNIPGSYSKITAAQAATALRSYLTTGDARWDLAVA